MATILGAEGDSTLYDLVFSRPTGFLVSFMYLAQASASGPANTIPSMDVPSLFANYVLPVALVIYFLIRDDRRERRNVREEAARKKDEVAATLRREEEEKTRVKQERSEAREREERMAKRIDELENFIHNSMSAGMAESTKAVNGLGQRIERMLKTMEDRERKE